MKSRVATAPTFCLAAAALCVAAPSSAETRRVAIVVGNNAGGPTEKPLHYAEEDATKVADVLAQLGDVHAEHLFLLKGRGRGDLQASIARATELVAGFRANPEDRTVLIFYYSGHSDGDALELGEDRVPYAELFTAFRRRIAGETPVDWAPFPTFADGVAGMAVLDAIRRADAERTWVNV